MKRILRSFFLLLLVIVWSSNALAVTSPYSYTFKSGDFSAKKKTSSLNGVNWTLAVDSWKGSEGYAWDNTKGLKIGSGNKNCPNNNVTITTSEITGTIKSVTVNCSTNSGASTQLKVLVGGTQMGKQVSLTNSPTNYDFTGSAKGTIVLSFSDSSTPLYLKSINVVFEDGPAKTLKSLAISGDATKKAYNDGEEFDPTGLVVTGTYDDASIAAITDGITWTKAPAKLAVGTTSCSVIATVNGVTSPAYKVTGLTVTKTITLSIDPATSTVVKAPVKVSLKATPGATVYYTTNGDEPSTSSEKYVAPFEVTKSGTTVKALAVADGAEDVTAEATYTIKPEQPVFSDESKTFSDAFDVTLSLPESTDATSKIYYAIGAEATAKSSLYEGPINISAETDGKKVVLHAVVVDQYGNVGTEKRCTYTKTTAIVFDFTNPLAELI